jgi:hypothetical protein
MKFGWRANALDAATEIRIAASEAHSDSPRRALDR